MIYINNSNNALLQDNKAAEIGLNYKSKPKRYCSIKNKDLRNSRAYVKTI